MKSQMKFNLGNKQITIECDGDEKTMIKNFSFWFKLPSKCKNCGSSNIGLMFKSPKGNDYYGLSCNDCGAEFNFGLLKAGGMYIKDDAQWSVYKKNSYDPAGFNDEPDIF